jgi:excisionase family DNA binding protein
MRSAVFDTAIGVDLDEQLSTGEAAKLLNSSRQHVVDLCERGQLPYTTVGTHRRVRRGDVEAIRQRTERLTRDQQRSLWLAYAVAGRIVSDPPAARATAHQNLVNMRGATRGSATRWLAEWGTLIAGPVEQLLAAYTSRDLRGRELRQNSPFAGLLSDEERAEVLNQWRLARNDAVHGMGVS